MNRNIAKKAATVTCAAALALSLIGCGAGTGTNSANASGSGTSNGNNAAASASTNAAQSNSAAYRATIGTLATEDILPFWVAADEGLFAEAGIDASIVTFQSATELIAAVTAGDVDYAMTDPMVAASIYAGGTDISIQWVTLGTTADQGRFGIITSNPDIKTLQDLAGKEIGVGSNTILEYVLDTLMDNAGIAEADIKTSELQKLPVRYQAMASGSVDAAALPASLLALGEANGFAVVADDTAGENISQSVIDRPKRRPCRRRWSRNPLRAQIGLEQSRRKDKRRPRFVSRPSCGKRQPGRRRCLHLQSKHLPRLPASHAAADRQRAFVDEAQRLSNGRPFLQRRRRNIQRRIAVCRLRLQDRTT